MKNDTINIGIIRKIGISHIKNKKTYYKISLNLIRTSKVFILETIKIAL